MTQQDLWRAFQAHQGRIVRKWLHYFPIYERHFGPWRGRTLTFFEIGVAKGGSLEMWRDYFGPFARIVGVDIDPKCAKLAGDDFAVRIGDQSDPAFLKSLVDEFGPPDIVLDDGSHQMAHVRATFDFLYPKLDKNGVYLVEDMHAAYWPEFGGGLDAPQSFVNHAKTLVDSLNAEHARGAVTPDAFTRETLSIAFYDSVVVFEKGVIPRRAAPERGKGARLTG
jgi:hypothetical protein